jgi:hypothetical protein
MFLICPPSTMLLIRRLTKPKTSSTASACRRFLVSDVKTKKMSCPKMGCSQQQMGSLV